MQPHVGGEVAGEVDPAGAPEDPAAPGPEAQEEATAAEEARETAGEKALRKEVKSLAGKLKIAQMNYGRSRKQIERQARQLAEGAQEFVTAIAGKAKVRAVAKNKKLGGRGRKAERRRLSLFTKNLVGRMRKHRRGVDVAAAGGGGRAHPRQLLSQHGCKRVRELRRHECGCPCAWC